MPNPPVRQVEAQPACLRLRYDIERDGHAMVT
jgi:hypothetical protein